MSYAREADMYQEVLDWLRRFLVSRFPRTDTMVYDTHAGELKDYIMRNGLRRFFREDLWQTYEISVDITGFIVTKDNLRLVFVECKNRKVTLRDLSQLLGYCRIARPSLAYLISPHGVVDSLKALILRYSRTDILQYDWPSGRQPSYITLARWSKDLRGLDPSSVLPPQSSGTFGVLDT